MIKKNLVVVLPLLVSACVAIPPEKWDTVDVYRKNGQNEIIRADSPIFLADDKVCEDKIFGQGVDVNGEIIHDKARLKKLLVEASSGKYSNRPGDPKKAKSVEEKKLHAMSSVLGAPKYIHDIFRMLTEENECMMDEGYRFTGAIRIHKETKQELKCTPSKPYDICRIAKESELTKEYSGRSLILK